MTQIKKTLSIAGIIAMATMPAMADIASTEYVNNIVNNVIPTSGTTGQVLRKAVNGRLEWADAPTPTLETTTGTSTTASMTQKAITDALDKKIENTAAGLGTNNFAIGGGVIVDDTAGSFEYVENTIAIGAGATADDTNTIAIGAGASAALYDSIAIGTDASVTGSMGEAIAIGIGAHAQGFGGDGATAIGSHAKSTGYGALAIGRGAESTEGGAIQLGGGTNNEAGTFKVWRYQLLDANATIPAGRLAVPNFNEFGEYDSENNGVSGQLLQTNGDGTMSWVDAPAPSLDSMLPTAPNNCKASDGQQCALVMTWSSSQNKFTYSWEVVKVSE